MSVSIPNSWRIDTFMSGIPEISSVATGNWSSVIPGATETRVSVDES